MSFPFDALRRHPDLEAPELSASDAADRLILDESDVLRAAAADGTLVVIGDTHGALTLASAFAGAHRIRVHQDARTGEQALEGNARMLGLEGTFTSLPLEAGLAAGARVVLLRLPRSLEELRDIAGLVAAHAAPDVTIVAGGRIKHMSLAMNDVLRQFFETLDVTRARQKSRVLLARRPHDGRDPVAREHRHPELVVCAYGGAFAGTSIDIGTRLLLESLPTVVPSEEAIDLACGTGIVATRLALRTPGLRVYASDQSAAAVASARTTAARNGVGDRVTVVRDDALSLVPDARSRFIALNPPFHSGAAVHEGVALRLFEDSARVLASGGELWTVWNSHLRYRPALERIVGRTRQVARNAKFTVTVSVAR